MTTTAFTPLAARMRPQRLAEFFGQSHLLAAGKPLRRAIEQGQRHSCIFWGPPGTGKTTLAQLMAQETHAEFVQLSAIFDGVKEIRHAITQAQQHQQTQQQATVLFVDEVHRFNRTQQEAFLPFIEDGTITFIGATTENPSFALVNALLSRTRVYVLQRLTTEEILPIIQRALQDKERGLGNAPLELPENMQQLIAETADGDARRALNLLEMLHDLQTPVTPELIQALCTQRIRYFDKQGDIFYDQISALHKAVRGSAPDAALYWLCRMLDGGCDPHYLARRITRMASEDIGNADPRALPLAIAAWEAYDRQGSPEGELALAQAVLYLACAPKSNACYTALQQAMHSAREHGTLPVPLHLRNAPTSLLKKLQHGKHYRYAHDEPNAYAAGENYFPDTMPREQYYRPVNQGLEIKIAEKLAKLAEWDQQAAIGKHRTERKK